jgi:hypothetical protein
VVEQVGVEQPRHRGLAGHPEAPGVHDVQDCRPALDLARRAQLDVVTRLPDQRELLWRGVQVEATQLLKARGSDPVRVGRGN